MIIFILVQYEQTLIFVLVLFNGLCHESYSCEYSINVVEIQAKLMSRCETGFTFTRPIAS